VVGTSLNPIDIETGHFRAGVKTTLAILSVVFAAGIAYAAFATKDDIVQAVKGHTADEYPHTKQFEAVKTVAQAAKAEAAAAKTASEKTDKRVYRLDAKIDFLIENEIEKARGSPVARQRARKAARSVRERVAADTDEPASSDDPLSGLDF
jgi:glutamate-1-semialdehyde aminotransferase